MIDEYQLLWKDIQLRIVQLKLDMEQQSNGQKEVDESVQVETLKFEQDSAVQVDTLSPLSQMTSLTSKDGFIYELETAISECVGHLNTLEDIVSTNEPQQATPELVNVGITISKLSASCQSNVELIKHLSNMLITECNCSDDEAQVSQVTELIERYERLLLLARKREQHIRNLRYDLCSLFYFIFILNINVMYNTVFF